MNDATPRAILLDIEGTTTPVTFVYDILFPFARDHARDFIREHYDAEELRRDLDALFAERREDEAHGDAPPPWREDTRDAHVESAAAYVHWLMDRDRKSTALKSLQGKIWEGGYRDGKLKAEVYEDVPPAFSRWRAQGRLVYIYSSGSVLAQRLLFAHTTHGDLTAHLEGYFDTTTGPKKESASYRSIAEAVNVPAPSVLFLSDVAAELDAAREAGMKTALCVRDGADEPASDAHNIVRTFDHI